MKYSWVQKHANNTRICSMLTMCYAFHVISEAGDVILILWGKLRLKVGNCPKSQIYEVKSRSTKNLSDDLDFGVQRVCVCVCVCVCVVCLSLCVFQSSFVLSNNVREIIVWCQLYFPQTSPNTFHLQSSERPALSFTLTSTAPWLKG